MKKMFLRRACAFMLALFFMAMGIRMPVRAEEKTTDTVQKEQQNTQNHTEPKTVRVGYTYLQGFLYQKGNGDYAGIAYELLQEIALYNNWEYEFVECGYSQAEEYFAEDKIDIFIPYQKTPERELVYEYSKEVFCRNKASLLTLPDKPIYYEDFAAMDGIVIGSAKGTRNDERFASFLKEKGCHVTIKKDYMDQEELIKAAKNNEIDAFISASNRSISDCKLVAVLSETDSYVIAKKGDRTCLDLIDHAMQEISVEIPNFMNNLNKKYQEPETSSYPPLTREEIEYVQQKKEVTVLISSQECDKNGEFAGSAKLIYDMIHDTTGLEFKPVVGNGSEEILKDFKEGKADIIYAFQHDYTWGNRNRGWITQPYAEFYNTIATRKSKSDIKSIAVVPNTYIDYYIRKNTKYEMITADSYKACIDLVLEGRADAAYLTSPIGNYYSTFPKYRMLSFLSTYDFASSSCMAVSQSSDPILVDILNKAILNIPQTTLMSAFETQMTSRKTSVIDLFYAYPLASATTALIIVIALAMLIFLLFYNRQIKQKNDQLAVANSAKTDFMSRMSHDMRTPMNGILGLTQLSRDEKDMTVIQDNLEQIEMSGKFLLNLINDTLDMNRIEAGRLELHEKPIDSEEVFKNVIANAGIMAKEKGVRLKLLLPSISHGKWVPVYADASRLEQVLMNIISNAIKFTPHGGIVTLEMKNLVSNKHIVKDQYIIRDTGIGMSEEFQKTIFEPFSQEGRSNSRREQGTGLGMSIVRQLVELMNGEIHIQSELDKGTEVTLIMQYRVYDGELERKEAREGTDDLSILNGKHGLLCEDHPLNAQIAKKLLEKQGIVLDHAQDGKMGVEMFSHSGNNQYDFILMDVRMPIMGGIEATRAIRNLPREDAKTIPIIAMTANAFEEDVKACKDAGMNDHISKPVEPQILYETLEKYLKQESKE